MGRSFRTFQPDFSAPLVRGTVWHVAGKIVAKVAFFMQESPAPPPRASPISAENRTRFPSLRHWETGHEPAPGLKQLRAKQVAIEAITALPEKRRRAEAAGLDQTSVRPVAHAPEQDLASGASEDQDAAIRTLVDQLDLAPEPSARLQADARLILAWYHLPAAQIMLGFGLPSHLEVLAGARELAGQLHDRLAPYAMQIEDLMRSVPSQGSTADDVDLVQLTADLSRFLKAADAPIQWLGPRPGRRRGVRRNQAIALITEAVEEATGMQVGVSRGNRNRDERHFTNPPGRFLLGVLRLLGHRNEQALVSVFEELRRPLRARK